MNIFGNHDDHKITTIDRGARRQYDSVIVLSMVILFFIFYSMCGNQLAVLPARPLKENDLLFEMDLSRTISYITSTTADFYRTNVHPIYAILVNPIGILLTHMGLAPTQTAIYLNSFFGALGTGLSYILFNQMAGKRFNAILLSFVFGLSTSQFFISAVPDTASLATLSLLFLYIIFWKSVSTGKEHKNLWILAGILTLGVTITNFIQTIICYQAYLLGKKKPNEFLKSSVIYSFFIITTTGVLAFIQKLIYPSSQYFFHPSVFSGELIFTSVLVLSQPLTVIWQLIKNFFLVNFIAPVPSVFNIGLVYPAITFSDSNHFNPIGWVCIAFGLVFILIGLLRNQKRIPILFLYGLSMCLLFNLFLHSVYGIGEKGKIELFLYTGNFTMIVLILLLGWTLYRPQWWVKTGLLIFIVMLAFNNLQFFQSVQNIYSNPEMIQTSDNQMRKLVMDLYEYRSELQSFHSEFKYSKYLPESDFYIFGMGNRHKYLYRNGCLTDLTTSEVIDEWNIREDVIVPPDYTVGMVTVSGENVFIIEDGTSIRIEEGNHIRMIESDSGINLPEFENYKYPKVMKVLHQEILINILNGKPTSNFLAYPKPWYRDAAMMGMVLNRTQNISLISQWILNLQYPYDTNSGENELDNLGEVLYLVSLVSDQEHPLVPIVLSEIQRNTSMNYLNGRTDYGFHPAYQTKWAKFGLSSLGIDNNLLVPDTTDDYSQLIWWDFQTKNSPVGSITLYPNYPYLTWAEAHYAHQKIGYISEGDYPLTWEMNASKADYQVMNNITIQYAQDHIVAPHAWHAAEALLYLMDED